MKDNLHSTTAKASGYVILPKHFRLLLAATVAVLVIALDRSEASADEPFIGEIRMFAGNFAPRGWAFCDGQLLPIAQNDALFSLVGTIYGGDGRTTFGLPDLRGRVPVHAGHGPGLSEIKQGQKEGVEKAAKAEDLKPSVPVRPYLGIRFIIALQGVYPSRN